MQCVPLTDLHEQIHLVSESGENSLEEGRYKLVQILCNGKVHLLLGKKGPEMFHDKILKAFLDDVNVAYSLMSDGKHEIQGTPEPSGDDYDVVTMGQIIYKEGGTFKKFPGGSSMYDKIEWPSDESFAQLEAEMGENVQFE